MDESKQLDARIEEGEGLGNGLELVKSVMDKHLDHLSPSARYFSMFKGWCFDGLNYKFNPKQIMMAMLGQMRDTVVVTGQATDTEDDDKGKYTLIRDAESFQYGIYDKPLPCFGCGIGWFSFLSGFVFPVMWYYATILYLGNYYRKDPRERAGLAASAIAAMACTVVLLIIAAVLLVLL